LLRRKDDQDKPCCTLSAQFGNLVLFCIFGWLAQAQLCWQGTPAAIPLQDEVSAVLALDFYLQQSEDEIRV